MRFVTVVNLQVTSSINKLLLFYPIQIFIFQDGNYTFDNIRYGPLTKKTQVLAGYENMQITSDADLSGIMVRDKKKHNNFRTFQKLLVLLKATTKVFSPPLCE